MAPTKLEERRFEVGATVMAKWPKTNLYFNGVILDFNDTEYLVQFNDEDKSELAIKFKDVGVPFPRRSRSRSLGRTPNKASKSPARNKSPSRKSPTRKSPSRKSPTQRSPTHKLTSEKNVEPQLDITTEPIVSKKSFEESKIEVTENSTTVRSRATRQSTRIAATVLQNKSDDKMNNTHILKVDTETVMKKMKERSLVWEFVKRTAIGGWVNFKFLPFAAVVVTLPFLFTLLCTAKKCQLQVPDIPTKLGSYYSQNASTIVGGTFASYVVLSLIPVGKVITTRSGSTVRCNGFLFLLAIAIGVGVLLKLQYNFAKLYLQFRHMLVASTALGLVLSLLVYAKSFYAPKDKLNPEGTSGYYLADLVVGREVSPRIGSLDLKFLLYRLSLLTFIVLDIVVVAKDLQASAGGYSPTLLVLAGMQILFLMDLIVFEESFFTSFEYLYDGLGLVKCVGYLNMPFLFNGLLRYVLNHSDELKWYCLLAVVALNLVGYMMVRGATSQKHAFRTNPASPALVHLESLPTSAGKRLLVSSWWGLVRHPNYLGTFLAQLAWVLVCGFKFSMPWLIVGFSWAYLFARIFQVEKQCRAKYGLAWTSYTARVPCRVIPKIF